MRKFLLIGDSKIGKTCLILSALGEHESCPTTHVPTVYDIYQAVFVVKDKPRSILIHNSAGQEEYDRLRQISHLDADAILLCFSIGCPDCNYNLEWKSNLIEMEYVKS